MLLIRSLHLIIGFCKSEKVGTNEIFSVFRPIDSENVCHPYDTQRNGNRRKYPT